MVKMSALGKEKKGAYAVGKCKKKRRYFRDGELKEIVQAAFFTDGEIGCPLAGNCGDFCTAFYFEMPKK
jgi:hypothetical protein